MDGQSERTIQILEDMLRACCMDWGGSWEQYLALAEFAYNNSFQASIGKPPFEALYGRPCRSPLCWEESGDQDVLSPDFVQECIEKISLIRQQLQRRAIRKVRSIAADARLSLLLETWCS